MDELRVSLCVFLLLVGTLSAGCGRGECSAAFQTVDCEGLQDALRLAPLPTRHSSRRRAQASLPSTSASAYFRCLLQSERRTVEADDDFVAAVDHSVAGGVGETNGLIRGLVQERFDVFVRY